MQYLLQPLLLTSKTAWSSTTTALQYMKMLIFLSYRLKNATLYIQSARSYDEGVYVCEASNTLGHSRNTAMLRVAGNFYTNLTET